jgi:hypothetical protein
MLVLACDVALGVTADGGGPPITGITERVEGGLHETGATAPTCPCQSTCGTAADPYIVENQSSN